MKKLSSSIALALPLAACAFLSPMTASADMTGNIGVHSKYVLRGITGPAEENDNAALQGGLDYSHDSGLYAGWWFSSLGYSSSPDSSKGVENDFYAGYAGDIGGLGYNVGLIQYYYIDVDDSNLTELTGKLSLGGGYVGMQYLLNDGAWGNAGDIYWKAGYALDLPSSFNLAFDLGYYTYDDSTSKYGVTTEQDSAFRHFNITLSHPIGNSGANMYAQYIVAGEDRHEVEYDDTMVFGITYGFDL